ncbi:Lrp/AsnC family transcriptional regulator [Tropicimonas marinistellae]|uniref:Lrp/AsnC family transcriptional regulator n=1 Tax=Tropicimonas marinistellae TaxID=1739787 RepID=UPI00082D2ED1|nr:AsnC family transcriptional regulator [Tropicimonas marinistellae]
MTHQLDDTDRALINRLQDDLPLTDRPFAAIGEALDLPESEVLSRLTRLREDGFITRFGPFFDAAALGGAFCLCAMSVPEADFETVVTKVNAHPEVAHNYEREHAFNMWFVLATENAEEIETVAREIEAETGIAVRRFPKEREFYIGFRVAA